MECERTHEDWFIFCSFACLDIRVFSKQMRKAKHKQTALGVVILLFSVLRVRPGTEWFLWTGNRIYVIVWWATWWTLIGRCYSWIVLFDVWCDRSWYASERIYNANNIGWKQDKIGMWIDGVRWLLSPCRYGILARWWWMYFNYFLVIRTTLTSVCKFPSQAIMKGSFFYESNGQSRRAPDGPIWLKTHRSSLAFKYSIIENDSLE